MPPSPQRGLSHTGRQLGKMDGPFPAGERAAHIPEGFAVLAAEGCKPSQSQTGGSGHFFKSWETEGYFCFILLGLGVFWKKRRKKERGGKTCCAGPSPCACAQRGQESPARGPPKWLPAWVPPVIRSASPGSGDPRRGLLGQTD